MWLLWLSLASRYTLEDLRPVEDRCLDGFEGYVVQIPANLTDDLLRDLDRAPAVRPGRTAAAEIERINTELDTVVLKSGHVFAGVVQRRGREVWLTVGETVLRFPSHEVESITPADSPRRLKIELHEGN